MALRAEIPAYAAIQLAELDTGGARVVWAAECLTASAKTLPAHVRGNLVALEGEPTRLYFVGRRGWRKISKRLELEGYEVSRERKFLSEDLVLFALDKRPKYTFVFDRTRAGLVKLLAQALKARLARPLTSTTLEIPAPADAAAKS